MVESGFNKKIKIFAKIFTSFFAKKLANFEFSNFHIILLIFMKISTSSSRKSWKNYALSPLSESRFERYDRQIDRLCINKTTLVLHYSTTHNTTLDQSKHLLLLQLTYRNTYGIHVTIIQRNKMHKYLVKQATRNKQF